MNMTKSGCEYILGQRCIKVLYYEEKKIHDTLLSIFNTVFKLGF